ncbi:N-acetyltransferase ESCO2 [Tribolium castaneum]|uniref:N-acetyltransferase ESCO acetyl-transferase domain-containing protein n=1 Tax=Tribolium castaneum TaxID=7070 RepID=D6WPF2_TRICA|nr:PREDICTED: N-acetyltransferase ESCO2 [Tribolium castaneum]EFA06803.2 hypothetical protein TcasGA2_TC009742 [Tribolium castaneum]|eukprot:XP_973162.1 PREDICTED: N-acetyltransferase ESCO2 [Tribolium castaneum]
MKPHPQIEHTPEVSSRRRALFPDSSPCDDDLGCISPLDFDEDCAKNVFSHDTCVSDYDIIGLVEKGHTVHTPNNTNITTKVFTPSTTNESPTQKLKTPHDAYTNTIFPKLIRSKTQVDTAPNQDCKNPKIRTALFPDKDMSLPSRKFYPKSDNEVLPRPFALTKRPNPTKGRKRNPHFLCNRRSKFSRSGQINAGVRHKIKKRKIRKISKIAALEAAINIIENSPLNTVLDSTESIEVCPESIQVAPEEPPRDPTPSPEPDPTKKFFKSCRHKAVVTVNPNIKLEMNNGRISLIQNKNPLKRPRVQEGISPKRPKLDFEPEKPLIPDEEISNIIDSLEDKENEGKNPDLLMSPTSQMCNMTSGLALNSPKKARDLSSVLESMPSNDKKLFPVFYPGKTALPTPTKENKVLNVAKKFRPISKDQMLLDAGQKRWGVTQCTECKFIYHMGDPGDEIMHLNYHNAGHIFRYTGWKNERVVSSDLRNGKVIQIVPGDSKIWWKKVKEVMEVINRDLGYFDIEFNTANSQIFFYVKSKVIIGALVAEVKTTGHKLLTTHQDQVDLCSEESYPVKCGVSRIWVARNHRQKGVATALMDALKRNFVFGAILMNEDIALSSPTEDGKIFGAKYFKTPNFFIYFV